MTKSTNNNFFSKKELLLESPEAKQLGGWSLLRKDLDFVIQLSNILIKHLEDENYLDRVNELIDHDNFKKTLWFSLVITYGKCFAKAHGRRVKLDTAHINALPNESKQIHESLILERNQYVAHSGISAYEMCHVLLCFNDELKTESLTKIVVWSGGPTEIQKVKRIIDLATELKKVVNIKIKKIGSRIRQQIQEKDFSYWQNKLKNQNESIEETTPNSQVHINWSLNPNSKKIDVKVSGNIKTKQKIETIFPTCNTLLLCERVDYGESKNTLNVLGLVGQIRTNHLPSKCPKINLYAKISDLQDRTFETILELKLPSDKIITIPFILSSEGFSGNNGLIDTIDLELEGLPLHESGTHLISLIYLYNNKRRILGTYSFEIIHATP